MSAFKNLRDVSSNFEADLRRLSTELFSAKIGEDFEDSVVKKFRDLALFRSKLRLLRAKPIANTPEVAEQEHNEQTTLENYEETATTKVLEQHIVKFLTQSHAVKALITAPNSSLDPELVERKEKIIEALSDLRQQESQLRHLQDMVRQRQDQLEVVRGQWDDELAALRDMKDGAGDDSMEVEVGPLHRKLATLVDKMELMRWLVSRLAAGRSGAYDWLGDPHRRLRALRAARQPCTLEDLLED